MLSALVEILTHAPVSASLRSGQHDLPLGLLVRFLREHSIVMARARMRVSVCMLVERLVVLYCLSREDHVDLLQIRLRNVGARHEHLALQVGIGVRGGLSMSVIVGISHI